MCLLNQCWLPVNCTPRTNTEWNTLENVVGKMLILMPRPQCINMPLITYPILTRTNKVNITPTDALAPGTDRSLVMTVQDEYQELRVNTPSLVDLPLLDESVHLINSHAKDEDVLWAHLFPHLHVGPIQGTDGQTTVHLHTQMGKDIGSPLKISTF